MAVAESQGGETPAKNGAEEGERKVGGPEEGLQVEQSSGLSPICIGQAQGEPKTYKKRSQSLSVSVSVSLDKEWRSIHLHDKSTKSQQKSQ